MGKRYLVVWLEGPLQSYGREDCIYARKTQRFPRRAALWGMVFSAAGWYDAQRERLAELLDCSLTVYGYTPDRPMLTDYQIVGGNWDITDPWQERMVPHRFDGKAIVGSATRPRTKQYLQESVFAAILEFPEHWESDLRRACVSPRDMISLGRKACIPTVPVLQGIANDFDSALELLEYVEENRNECFETPVYRRRVFEETTDRENARWSLNDVPLSFRPTPEYGWRYVNVRQL